MVSGSVATASVNFTNGQFFSFGTPVSPAQICPPAAARAQGSQWNFGLGAGLDFGTSGTTVTAIAHPNNLNTGGTLTVTNTGGQTLFYASGTTVYNAQNAAMTNGTLTGNATSEEPITRLCRTWQQQHLLRHHHHGSQCQRPALLA